MRSIVKTLLAALAVAMLTAIPAAAQPIKVGTIFPLSGGAGPNGQAVTNAIKVMAQMLNAQGGVLGRQIAVISKDDESTPAVGVSRANELIADKVDVIIAAWNSPVALAMQPVIARANILDITAVAKADPILSGEGNPYAIRINSSNGQDAGVIARALVQTLGAKRIGFLTQNDAYGNGAQAAIEQELGKLGKPYEVVVTEKFPFKQIDFRVQLANVKQAKPDAVVAINAAEASGHARADPAVPPGRHRRQARRRRRHHPAHGVQGGGRRHRRHHLVRHLLPRPRALHQDRRERPVRRRRTGRPTARRPTRARRSAPRR